MQPTGQSHDVGDEGEPAPHDELSDDELEWLSGGTGPSEEEPWNPGTTRWPHNASRRADTA